jgi:hypothetical protein
MKLSVPRLKALQILHDVGECTSREVARRLWPDKWERTSHQGVHGQWLPGLAARMLYGMNKDGLVSMRYPDGGGNVRWSIAGRGTAELELVDDKPKGKR